MYVCMYVCMYVRTRRVSIRCIALEHARHEIITFGEFLSMDCHMGDSFGHSHFFKASVLNQFSLQELTCRVSFMLMFHSF